MPGGNPPSELESRPQSRREWSGWLPSLVLPLAIVGAIVGVLLYIEDGRGADVAGGFGTVELPEAKNPTGSAPAAQANRAAPDFLLETLAGEELRLSDLQGRPVLVNFWATWCTSCRAEMPDLVRAYESHSSEGFLVIGVNLREADSLVEPFVNDFGISFPVLMDRTGEVARTWRIGGPSEGLPSSYFIDAQGIVLRVFFGTLTAKTLDEGLSLILDRP